MKRYANLWLAQARYAITREMMFKGNFILWIMVEILWFILQLTFVRVLYFNVEEVAGWTMWQMVLLVTTSHIIQQIFQALFMVNCMQVPDMVRTGKLDFYLAQPVNPQFLVSTRLFDPGAVVNLVFAIGLAIYAAMKCGIAWSVFGILGYGVMCLFGVLVHYAFMVTFMSMAFWLTRADGFLTPYYNMFQLARLPREAFTGVVRWVFTWGLPILLVANVPAHTLLHGPDMKTIALLIVLSLASFGVASAVFNAGLRRYGSASS